MILEALCFTISITLLVLFDSEHSFEDEDYSIFILWFAVGLLVLFFLNFLYCYHYNIKNYFGITFLLLSVIFQTSILSDIIGLKGCFQVDTSIFCYITFSVSISTFCLVSTSMTNLKNDTAKYKKIETNSVLSSGLTF